ncbi:glycosyltransferase [uncultured Pseudodesulfovibrio sp.]|uniref:glycosyltransferase n=1 Tax=uncultured Pseudodesulfovibrio sp. TaxID=2035858 RepID=UPI0029C89703|nr:glycosyltransferase [uncultured Pseudodesulfovibrio sp.]
MNIVFVNSTRKWGGVKTWTVDYATELAARGHDVRVFGRQTELIDTLRAAGINARQVNFGFDYNPLAIGRFVAAFLRSSPDVVIGNIGKDINTAGVAAAMLGIPIIQRVGLPGDMVSSARLRILHSITRPWMLCPSKTVADGVWKRLPHIPADKVRIILNAKKPVDSIRPVGDGPLRLVSTSQINQDKRHVDVLDALTAMQTDSFHYDIVGTGKLLDELREKYRALEERGVLAWHGFSTNVLAHLSEADVFLLPSENEGMPNSLLEAMAAGLIPVARDIGGIGEIWPDALADYLLPADAGPDQFSMVLKRLLTMDKAHLNTLKEASVQACRDTFNLNTKIDEFETWVQTDILKG